VRIGGYIAVLHRHSRAFYAPRLAAHGLPGPALPILLHVLRKPGLNQDDISRRAFVDKTLVSRVLGELEKAGFVSRTVDPDDTRIKRVHPTERAQELRPVLEGWLDEWNEILRADLSDEEQETVANLLRRMAETARSEVDADGGRCAPPQDDGAP
jgi:MarR family transcriptional regulator, temperature-dependent positive regulator of motility